MKSPSGGGRIIKKGSGEGVKCVRGKGPEHYDKKGGKKGAKSSK